MINETALRSIDAQVAERVMGWKWIAFDASTFPHGSGKGAEFCTLELPSDAMAVLKKCAVKVTVTIEYGPGTKGIQWMVARLDAGREDFCKCDPTIELAICQFALELFPSK